MLAPLGNIPKTKETVRKMELKDHKNQRLVEFALRLYLWAMSETTPIVSSVWLNKHEINKNNKNRHTKMAKGKTRSSQPYYIKPTGN